MSRGIGARQMIILRVLNESIPEGKAIEIRQAYAILKNHFYPDLIYYTNWYFPYEKYREGKHLTPEYWQRSHKLNAARVSICSSVKGLIQNGCINKYKKYKGLKPLHPVERIICESMGIEKIPVERYETFISLTDKGRNLVTNSRIQTLMMKSVLGSEEKVKLIL